MSPVAHILLPDQDVAIPSMNCVCDLTNFSNNVHYFKIQLHSRSSIEAQLSLH